MKIDPELIAPCGMNCGICSGYLAREFKVKDKGLKMPYCEGCRARDKKCAFIKKQCELLLSGKIDFCYECKSFPCERLEKLDKRYRERYHMSMIENLESVKKEGMSKLLTQQIEKWECPDCGKTICCHNGICFGCSLEKLKRKKKFYIWEDD